MRLETLTVRGFLAFDLAQQLDLRELPPGLIAIVGPNGAGKSALLDGALGAVYRQFPSRGAKELVDYARDREAYLDATFAMDGRGLYRARVNVDGVRRQTEAVLELIDAAGEHRLLNDGKVSTYDAAIAAVFPPLAVVLASAFAAQNKAGSFITLDRKGRKDLFAELLGLQHYETLATRARQEAAQVEQARAIAVALRDRLTQETSAAVEAALAARADRLRLDAELLERRQREIQAALDTIAHDREACQAEAARYATAQTTRDRLQTEIAAHAKTRARLDEQLAQLQADTEAEDERLGAQLSKTEQGLDREMQAASKGCTDAVATAEQIAAETRADLQGRITNNRRLLDDADAIRQAARDLESAEAQHTLRQRTIEIIERDLTALTGKRDAQQAVVTKLEKVAGDLARAAGDAALLGSVPCEGVEPYDRCQFLARAGAAAAAQPVLEAEAAKLEPARDALAQLKADRQALEDSLTMQHRRELTRLQTEIATLKVRAKHVSQIEIAEARIADYEGQLPEITALLTARRTEAEARLDSTLAAIAARRTAAQHVTAQAHGELVARTTARTETLTRERETLDSTIAEGRKTLTVTEATLAATADAHARLQQLDGEQTAQQRAWASTEADRGRLDAERVALARDEAALGDRRRELAEASRQLATLDQDLVEWQLLARIFSRDGLPVLEIAAAGPTVSSYTTDLLQSCSGPRFTVDLVTQEAKVSGKGLKEVFELKVYDGERGGEPRDLTDLSGGEQVLVDECLKSAIAIYTNERSATPIRTCWRDETTGALHPETVPHYVAMLRRLQTVGGFHHVLFVTHSPDAAAQADAQIVVREGRLRVALPPYQEAA